MESVSAFFRVNFEHVRDKWRLLRLSLLEHHPLRPIPALGTLIVYQPVDSGSLRTSY
jgi:hypothetical protein